MKSLPDYGYDGQTALRRVLETSMYGSLEQAVASLTVFVHPETASTLDNCNVFRIIRGGVSKRGVIEEIDGIGRVMWDDNKGPTDAFIWPHGIKRGKFNDIQFNHIWSRSTDVSSYTNLANICIMPIFLSKLSDTYDKVKALLRYRSFVLYEYFPSGVDSPDKPDGYDELNWVDPLPAIDDLEATYRRAMSTKPKDRTTISAREIGWYFSSFEPDPTL